MPEAPPGSWWVWLSTHIRPEVYGMHLHRHVWQETQSVLRANPALPESYWWDFLAETYAVTQTIALRRQVDTRRGTISLVRLLDRIARHARLVTRDYFLSHYGDDRRAVVLGEQHWEETFAGRVGDHLDSAIPRADLAALTAAVSEVKNYVDEHLAHRSEEAQPAQVTVTFEDVHAAIDAVGHAYRKYFGLVSGATMLRLTPEIQGDWKAVFRQPWLKQDD
jgi:hypothetical protein